MSASQVAYADLYRLATPSQVASLEAVLGASPLFEVVYSNADASVARSAADAAAFTSAATCVEMAVPRSLPSASFAAADAVAERAQIPREMRRQRNDADQPLALEDRHLVDAIEGFARHRGANLGRRIPWPGGWDASGEWSGEPRPL